MWLGKSRRVRVRMPDVLASEVADPSHISSPSEEGSLRVNASDLACIRAGTPSREEGCKERSGAVWHSGKSSA